MVQGTHSAFWNRQTSGPLRLRIRVGSTNPVKLDAVRVAFTETWTTCTFDFEGYAASSGVRNQPISLDETIRGAITRARSAFRDCDLSVGLEDGLFAVPHTQSGYMNVCACAIFDGRDTHLGLAPSFEYPIEVVQLVIVKGLDVTQAFAEAGLSDDPALGSDQGAIGVLTKGRVTRRRYAEQAVAMALIHLPATS